MIHAFVKGNVRPLPLTKECWNAEVVANKIALSKLMLLDRHNVLTLNEVFVRSTFIFKSKSTDKRFERSSFYDACAMRNTFLEKSPPFIIWLNIHPTRNFL